MKSAVIITSDGYPCGDAGAVRQHSFAKILQRLGYEVMVLGYGKPTNGKKGTYDGVNYVTFRPNSSNLFLRIAYRLVSNWRMMRFLRAMEDSPDVLLVVGVNLNTYHVLEKYAHKHECVLIHDSVEWYSAEEFTDGEKNREYRIKDTLNTKVIGANWRVIAISNYLREHFEKHCAQAVRIPVIMDVEEIAYRTEIENLSDKVRFVYAGSPGRKDYLAELLKGFSLLTEDQLRRMEVHLYGINCQQLLDVCGVDQNVLDCLDDCLMAHGRVPRAEAVQAVMNADYSMLLRDETLRYAKAGFPTKIVECLSCGTVPFCNLSSDLDMYLEDGKNAVLIDGHTPEAVKIAVEKALSYSVVDRSEMRALARKTAEEHFDYKQYVSSMQVLTCV